ncbi:uncharacterized protein DEA37_0004096 [Paragonimus westermani]|uniref:G-protein coupled receptors family 1 profile domain-containing protein n=1 Tax=Paragonimus westermani TaxID=34504 RepID=A0A5J4NUN4_9TREM|nr:uncharacterized protein DEA37_0004096 [Paragonimus westermani]
MLHDKPVHYYAPLRDEKNIKEAFRNSSCFPYSNVVELFDVCHNDRFLFALARIFTGFAATMTWPTVVFGTLTNLLLALMLSFRIRRPRMLEMYACPLALLDAAFMTYVGLYYLEVFGASWWNMVKQLTKQRSPLACRTSMFVFDFILSSRVNLLFFTIIHEVISDKQGMSQTGYSRFRICIQIFAIFTLTVIQAAPALFLFGLWQHQGVFVCDIDPLWTSVFRKYYRIHVILFGHGLVQNGGLVCLLVLLKRRLNREQNIQRHIQAAPLSPNPIHLAMFRLKCQLNDSCRNLRIVFMQGTLVCAFRLICCTGKLISQTFVELVHRDIYVEFKEQIAWTVVWQFSLFVELVLAISPYLLWHINIPEVRTFWRAVWRYCTCHRCQNMSELNERNSTRMDYYGEAEILFGEKRFKWRQYQTFLKHLKGFERQLQRSVSFNQSYTVRSKIDSEVMLQGLDRTSKLICSQKHEKRFTVVSSQSGNLNDETSVPLIMLSNRE